MPKIGTRLYDIPPRAGNPRNSEGAFLTLKDGRILFVYSRFIGEKDWDCSETHLIRLISKDGGHSWGDEKLLYTTREHGAENIMSVSLMRMKNGDIGLFYLVRQTHFDMRMVLRRSSDEGESFGEMTYCIPRDGYFVVNNDRVTRLSDGRIVIPAAEHLPLSSDRHDGSIPHYSRAHACFFYSKDDARSWYESSETVALNGMISWTGLQEPGIVERRNGVLWAHCRTDLGRHYEFFSLNGGMNWTPPVPSRFTGPCSPLCIKRMPDGRLIAVWNPVPDYPTRDIVPGCGGRTPLVCAVSKDDGLSWNEPKIIEDDERSGYCYTAIHFTEEGVLLGYCAGSADTDRACLNRTRFTMITWKELE